MKNAKMILVLALAAVISLSMLTVPAFAGGGNYHGSDEIEGIFYYTVADGEATVTGITDAEYSGELVIPSTLGGCPVVAIAGLSFQMHEGISNVVFPDTLVSIGWAAFSSCTGLTSVIIPDSVKTIDDQAFSGCTGVTKLIIGNGVEEIGKWVFNDMAIESVNIPAGLSSIGWAPFQNCANLNEITVDEKNSVYHSANNCLIETASKTLFSACNSSVIPTDGSITAIGEYAFSGFGFTEIAIPQGVTSIYYCAFYRCDNLKTVTLPASVTSINGQNPFSNCESLEKFIIDKANTSYHVYGNCLIETARKRLVAGTKNSIIPADGRVTIIGDSAFYGCIGLDWIVIPDGVTVIDEYAFSDCGITGIVLPKSITEFGEFSFERCANLTDVYYAGTEQDRANITLPEWFGPGDINRVNWHYNYIIPKHIPGDINKDDKVNNKDLVRLFQYLSKWEVEVDDNALDVNGDRKINNKDLVRLFQYLSKWDVEVF